MVAADAGAADDAGSASRARVVSAKGEKAVDVTGDHGRTVAQVPPVAGASLVLAEPAEWADHARVTLDGQVLRAKDGAAQPTYALPPDGGRLVIEVASTHQLWRWAQLGLLAAVAFLALPLGGRTRRSKP